MLFKKANFFIPATVKDVQAGIFLIDSGRKPIRVDSFGPPKELGLVCSESAMPSPHPRCCVMSWVELDDKRKLKYFGPRVVTNPDNAKTLGSFSLIPLQMLEKAQRIRIGRFTLPLIRRGTRETLCRLEKSLGTPPYNNT